MIYPYILESTLISREQTDAYSTITNLLAKYNGSKSFHSWDRYSKIAQNKKDMVNN